VVHVDVCVDVDVCVSGAELFPAINFYSSDRELQLELVEVAGAAIIDCGLKSEGPADTAVPVAAAAATTVPTTVYTAIAGGLFDGGLLLPVEQTHRGEHLSFLNDVIAGDAGTSGGRLAHWLCRIVDQERTSALLARRAAVAQWKTRLGIVDAAGTSAKTAIMFDDVFASAEVAVVAEDAGAGAGVGAGASAGVDGDAAAAAKPWTSSLIRSDSAGSALLGGLFGSGDDDEWEVGDALAAAAAAPALAPAPVAAPAPVVPVDTSDAAIVPQLGHDGGWEWYLLPSPVPQTLQLSEENAKALRSAFAAVVWQHGLVRDAIAASAYLRHSGNPGVGALPLPEELETFLATLVSTAAAEAKAAIAAAPVAAAPAAGAGGVEEAKAVDADAKVDDADKGEKGEGKEAEAKVADADADADANKAPRPPAPAHAADSMLKECVGNTDGVLPPVLADFVRIFRTTCRFVMVPLIREQAKAMEAAAAEAAAAGPAEESPEAAKSAEVATPSVVATPPAAPAVVEAPAAEDDDSDFDDDHRLAPYEGPSVLCSKCSMYGPSMQTGNQECIDCKLCEKCCEKNEECPKATKDNRVRALVLRVGCVVTRSCSSWWSCCDVRTRDFIFFVAAAAAAAAAAVVVAAVAVAVAVVVVGCWSCCCCCWWWWWCVCRWFRATCLLAMVV
jgi:hypothetical protein